MVQHHWARGLSGLGHDVKLVAPEAVRPFVRKGKKNDAADAAAVCGCPLYNGSTSHGDARPSQASDFDHPSH